MFKKSKKGKKHEKLILHNIGKVEIPETMSTNFGICYGCRMGVNSAELVSDKL
jgi:hypothetical protein